VTIAALAGGIMSWKLPGDDLVSGVALGAVRRPVVGAI
jgi:hypothetical protein